MFCSLAVTCPGCWRFLSCKVQSRYGTISWNHGLLLLHTWSCKRECLYNSALKLCGQLLALVRALRSSGRPMQVMITLSSHVLHDGKRAVEATSIAQAIPPGRHLSVKASDERGSSSLAALMSKPPWTVQLASPLLRGKSSHL
jgi:hypothetical protein